MGPSNPATKIKVNRKVSFFKVYVHTFGIVFKCPVCKGVFHSWVSLSRGSNAFHIISQSAIIVMSIYSCVAVYMSKNRPMWENSTVFPNTLSQKPSSSSELDGLDEAKPHSPKKQKLNNSSDPSAVQTSSQPLDRASAPTWGPGDQGCTYELCAGLVDKDLPLENIAREEILEETGYDVPLDALERVNSYCSNIGTAGTQQFLFYCEVTDDMLTGSGGGNTQEGEKIEVVYIPLEKSIETVFDDSLAKSSSLCFGFFWFDKNKRSRYST